MSITLQFATERSLGSWVIRTFEAGWASHVDTVLPDGRLLGARTDGGVLIRNPGYAAFTRIERVELLVTPEVTSAYYDFIQAQVGKPYDMTAIMAFALRRQWRETDSWFCSELVAAGLEASGSVSKLATPSNRITPVLLYFLCCALPQNKAQVAA